MIMDYQQKYLKYKFKFINLRKQIDEFSFKDGDILQKTYMDQINPSCVTISAL